MPVLLDGARLGYGKLERFIHNDIDHLEQVLQSIPDTVGRLIIVDRHSAWKATLLTSPTLCPWQKWRTYYG